MAGLYERERYGKVARKICGLAHWDLCVATFAFKCVGIFSCSSMIASLIDDAATQFEYSVRKRRRGEESRFIRLGGLI